MAIVNDIFQKATQGIREFGEKGYYEAFYNSFLTKANSLPINSLWIVFIESIPGVTIQQTIKRYEKNFNFKDQTITKMFETGKRDATRVKGILFAQGVIHPGESFEVTRVGIKNTGLIQGLIGQGRTGFPTFDVSFLENNLSMVDYVLRPWTVAVAHDSLKNQNLKTNIYVWHLSKMGPNVEFSKRKVFLYKNCCPISIDSQEYNYSGSDVNVKRTVKFAFNHYEIQPCDTALLSLIDDKLNIKNMIKQAVKQTIATAKDKAIDFGQNLVLGTIGNIITNTEGAVTDAIGNAIENVKGTIRQGATGLTNNINDVVNNAIGSLTGNNNESSNAVNGINNSINDGVGSITRNIKNNDTPNFSEQNRINIAENRQIGTLKLPDVNKKNNQNDAPNHTISTENFGVFTHKTINQDDTPIFYKTIKTTDNMVETTQNAAKAAADLTYGTPRTPNNFKEIEISQSDYVKQDTSLPTYRQIKINEKDDSRSPFTLESFKQVNINKNDTTTNVKKIPYKIVNINDNDTPSHP